MSFRRRALFLAGLFVAVSCSDAGNPVSPEGPLPGPDAASDALLQAFICSVDASGRHACVPESPQLGEVPGAISIGNVNYASLVTSNLVDGPTTRTVDVALVNHIQTLGTLDGVTPHSYGIRIWVEPPFLVDTIVPGQPTSVTVSNADGTMTWAAAYPNRPYFQYPGLLPTGDTSVVKTWAFSKQNVNTFSYKVFVATEVQFPKGWIDITPTTPVVEVGQVDTLAAAVRGPYGNVHTEKTGLTWTSSDPSIVTVAELSPRDTIAAITGVAEGSAWIKAVSSTPADSLARRDSVLVTVNNAPVVPLDSIAGLTNVAVRLSPARLRQGLAEGDSVVPGQVIDTDHGHAVIDAERGFTYVTDGGFAGLDTVRYSVTDGTWTVQRRLLVKVEPTNYWFVQQGATGDGSNTRPFGSLAAATAAAGANDSIFVLRNGSNDLVGAATLGAGQALIGHGVPAATLLKRDELNEAGRADTVFQGQALGSPLANTGAAPLTVLGNNLVEGVNITSTDAAGIRGVDFGTLTTAHVIVQANGPALSLVNGTLAGSFTALHSADSDSTGLTLNNVAGTLSATAASISGAAGISVSVAGGSVGTSFPGDITHGNGNALLAVSSSHTGTLAFTGTLTATNGTGLQFDNADGTYAFTTATLSNSAGGGADAGVDVVNGSAGTFLFAEGSSITNPAGNVFRIEGSAPIFTYAGTFSKNSGGVGVQLHNNLGGTFTFSGVSKSLNTGGSDAVSVQNTTGSVLFSGGGLALSTTTGRGFVVNNVSSVQVTGVDNTVNTTGATAVSIQSTATGTGGISFRSVNSSGGANAILLSTVSGAGFQITGSGTAGSGGILSATGTALSITTADSTRLRRVALTAPAAVNASTFGGLRLDSASVTSTAGAALGLATGRLYVSDVAVSSTGGAALTTSSVTLSGALSSLSATTAAGNAVALNNNTTGALTVAGGSITMNVGAGAAITASGSGNNAAFTYAGDVTQAANAALLDVTSGHAGTLTFQTGTVAASSGTGLQFTDADGTYNFTGSLNLAGGDAGIDIAAASSGTVNVNPSGSAAITSPSGTAITVAGGSADLTYRGNVTQANNVPLLSVTNGHTGDVSFPSGTVSATNGNGLQFDNADGTYSFAGTVTLAGGDAGIDITNGSGGTFTFPSTATITNPNAGNLVSILNSAPTFTYSGAFTKTNNNVTGILAQSNTGGLITFNGSGVTKSISSGSAAAVNLVNNSGTSFIFSGGSLSLTSGTGNGLSATGGGTLQVTGASNTITSAGGIALNVQNTTIGASGLSFLSISASGGANGIVLNNTGGNGLQVTGSSTHGSGGTIVNSTGADGAVAGNGVYLEDATNVQLSWMNLSGHQNHAIRGVDVNGVTFTRLRITGTNGTNVGSDEGSISFSNLTGSASITSSYIEGGAEDNVRVVNTGGTLNRLTMDNDTIGHNGTSGNAGVLLNGFQTAVLNATVQNTRFTGSRSNNIMYVMNENSSGDVVISGNTLTNTHPNKLGSDFGIYVAHASSGAVTYSVASNSVNNAGGAAIEVDRGAGSTGTMTGSINANTVGTAGVANSGSNAGSGIFVALVGAGSTATHTTSITNNTIRQFTNYGIELLNSGTGNGYLNATVTGNNIAQPSPNSVTGGFPTSGIRATLAVSSGPPAHDGRTCLNISGNTLNATGTSISAEIRVFGRFGSRTGLPGLTGSGANALISGQNTITVAPGGFGAVNATSTNAFQSSCPPV